MRKLLKENYQQYTRFFKKGRKKNSLEFQTLKSFKKELKKYVLNEAKILKELQHQNIIKYYNWYETKNHFWVIYEYLGGNNLRQIVEEDGNIEEPLLRQLTLQILETLIFMNQRDIFFVDFKPSNFMFNEYSQLKLGDFILAQMKKEIDFQNGIFSADKNFLAPEIKESKREQFIANEKTEIFGFGCLLYFLASGKITDINKNQQYLSIQGYSSSFNNLLESCLEYQPEKRANWSQIVNHEWIGILKDQQQHIKQILNFDKNIDKVSDISDQTNFKFDQITRKGSQFSRKRTETFLDDNTGTMKNIFSEQNLERKHSRDKDSVSQKSVNYLDVSIQNKSSNQNGLNQESTQNFQIPIELFQKIFENMEKNLLYQSYERVNEHITLNDNIEKVSLGSVEQILNITQNDLQDEQAILQHLNQLQKKWIQSEETTTNTEILKFIIKLTPNSQITNALISHQLYDCLISELSKTSSQSLRYYLCIVIGCIFRFITKNVQIVQVQTYQEVFQNLIESQNSQVSNKALAAFGEIMYYLFTLSKSNMNQISKSFIIFLAGSLKTKINDIIYLRYAAKIIENCSSTQCGKIFAKQNLIKNLLLCMKKNKDYILNSYCLNIFKYLIDIDPKLVTFITTKDNINLFLQQVIKENHKTSRDAINLVNKIFLLIKPQKIQILLQKIGTEKFFQLVIQNLSSNYEEIAAKFILTISILISKDFYYFEYIIRFTKILHVIDSKLKQNTKQINEYLKKMVSVLQEIISLILHFWFNKWRNSKQDEDINQQCIMCCRYLNSLSEIQFFIDEYINHENLLEIFCFGETVTEQIQAQNYDILKSDYVHTLENIIQSDFICQQYQSTFINKILPYLIDSLQKEQIESILYMNFAIFIDVFNKFFGQSMIDNEDDQIKNLSKQILNLSHYLIKNSSEEEIPINCFRIIATLLIKQYVKNNQIEFNPQQQTDLIREYVKDNSRKLNLNIFSIMIFILQQNPSYLFKFYRFQLIHYAFQYLTLLNQDNYELKIFFFFYTVFEIIHKAQKKQQLPKDFELDIESVCQIMKKIYKDFFSNNIVEEDMVNIFYYCFQILQIYQQRNKIEIKLDFKIEQKIINKMNDLFQNEKIILKKIQKLKKMTSQLY